jgi:hypothetical protein
MPEKLIGRTLQNVFQVMDSCIFVTQKSSILHGMQAINEIMEKL